MPPHHLRYAQNRFDMKKPPQHSEKESVYIVFIFVHKANL